MADGEDYSVPFGLFYVIFKRCIHYTISTWDANLYCKYLHSYNAFLWQRHRDLAWKIGASLPNKFEFVGFGFWWSRKYVVGSAQYFLDHLLSLVHIELTHWGRDKMDAILQTRISSVFSWMKVLEFRLKFHWSLFLNVTKGPVNNTSIGSNNGSAPSRRQAIILTNDGSFTDTYMCHSFSKSQHWIFWLQRTAETLAKIPKISLKFTSISLGLRKKWCQMILPTPKLTWKWRTGKTHSHELWKKNNHHHQSIKSMFVKGAGAHPQNAPCRRRSHALRSAPVRRGRLLSTVLHRWSPWHSILSAGLRWTTRFQILLHALIPSLLRPSRALPPGDWPGPHPIYLTIRMHDMPKPPKPTAQRSRTRTARSHIPSLACRWSTLIWWSD